MLPSRSTCATSFDDKALTTDAPTPCNPPDAPYAPPPNFPPAWSSVRTTSKAETFLPECISTGIPRPLSDISTDPSRCSRTSRRLAKPAAASSTALSINSQTKCMRPWLPVPPMYIPGLFLTASRPSKVCIASAS